VRPSRDRWLWLGGLFLVLFAFLAAVAIAYFAKGPHYSLWSGWMLAAGVSFVASFTCLFAATGSFAIPLRQPRRFPAITLDIYAAGSTHTEREGGSGLDVAAHLRSFNVRISNSDASQTASLTVRLYVKLVPGSWGRASEFVAPPPSWTLPRALSLDPLAMPIDLAPGDAASGQLVFELPSYYLDKMATPLDARLEISDRGSAATVSVPARVGKYDPGNMTKVRPGAEMLGPEFEIAPVAAEVEQPQA
jgi:hypothetical protein